MCTHEVIFLLVREAFVHLIFGPLTTLPVSQKGLLNLTDFCFLDFPVLTYSEYSRDFFLRLSAEPKNTTLLSLHHILEE